MMELNLTRVDYLQVIVLKYSSLFWKLLMKTSRNWMILPQTAFVNVWSALLSILFYTISACKRFILFVCVLKYNL